MEQDSLLNITTKGQSGQWDFKEPCIVFGMLSRLCSWHLLYHSVKAQAVVQMQTTRNPAVVASVHFAVSWKSTAVVIPWLPSVSYPPTCTATFHRWQWYHCCTCLQFSWGCLIEDMFTLFVAACTFVKVCANITRHSCWFKRSVSFLVLHVMLRVNAKQVPRIAMKLPCAHFEF